MKKHLTYKDFFVVFSQYSNDYEIFHNHLIQGEADRAYLCTKEKLVKHKLNELACPVCPEYVPRHLQFLVNSLAFKKKASR